MISAEVAVRYAWINVVALILACLSYKAQTDGDCARKTDYISIGISATAVICTRGKYILRMNYSALTEKGVRTSLGLCKLLYGSDKDTGRGAIV